MSCCPKKKGRRGDRYGQVLRSTGHSEHLAYREIDGILSRPSWVQEIVLIPKGGDSILFGCDVEESRTQTGNRQAHDEISLTGMRNIWAPRPKIKSGVQF
jgi:hypothetical protein